MYLNIHNQNQIDWVLYVAHKILSGKFVSYVQIDQIKYDIWIFFVLAKMAKVDRGTEKITYKQADHSPIQ